VYLRHEGWSRSPTPAERLDAPLPTITDGLGVGDFLQPPTPSTWDLGTRHAGRVLPSQSVRHTAGVPYRCPGRRPEAVAELARLVAAVALGPEHRDRAVHLALLHRQVMAQELFGGLEPVHVSRVA